MVTRSSCGSVSILWTRTVRLLCFLCSCSCVAGASSRAELDGPATAPDRPPVVPRRTIIFSYDRRDDEEIPFLPGFRRVNSLYAERHEDYEYRFYQSSSFDDLVPPTWIKVFLANAIFEEVLLGKQATGAASCRAADTSSSSSSPNIKKVRKTPTSTPPAAHAVDAETVAKIRETVTTKAGTYVTTNSKRTSGASSSSCLAATETGTRTTSVAIATSKNDIQVLFLDSDAVWHAHDVRLEELFPESMAPDYGFVVGPSDADGRSLFLPHTNSFLARGERGFQLLRYWKQHYLESVRKLWFVFAKNHGDGSETEMSVAPPQKWEPAPDPSSAGEATLLHQRQDSEIRARELQWKCFYDPAARRRKTAANVGSEVGVDELASSTTGTGSKAAPTTTTTTCSYPYYGYDPLSLLLLMKRFPDGFAVLPWSRLNNYFPWTVGVRRMTSRMLGRRNGEQEIHYLTLEHDDNGLLVPASSPSSSSTCAVGAASSGHHKSIFDRPWIDGPQNLNFQTPLLSAGTGGDGFASTRSFFSTSVGPFASSSSLSPAKKMQSLSHNLEMKKITAEYNGRKTVARYVGTTRKQAEVVDQYSHLPVPRRDWVLCSHFHWKDRAWAANEQRLGFRSFLYLAFAAEYMGRYWPQIPFYREKKVLLQ
ncbi:unnamed protein product [Amoebophrya sp. A120]|nr:unnamed protein product [Amoebophrya sp. A120]|eukprot:GSA120T00001200001.1